MNHGRGRRIFEHRRESLIPRPAFFRRVAGFGTISIGIVAFSLGIGILGYRCLEGMEWIDAFLNASMIMGGMGPVGELRTFYGKLFAGFYALYCGLVLLVSAGILLAPIYHRFLHRFHLEAEEERKG